MFTCTKSKVKMAGYGQVIFFCVPRLPLGQLNTQKKNEANILPS